jgi:hypothetical protein
MICIQASFQCGNVSFLNSSCLELTTKFLFTVLDFWLLSIIWYLEKDMTFGNCLFPSTGYMVGKTWSTDKGFPITSPEDRNRFIFQNVTSMFFLEYEIMRKVQKSSDSDCNVPLLVSLDLNSSFILIFDMIYSIINSLAYVVIHCYMPALILVVL